MVIFVLRHADRQPDPADDLTPPGIERAKLLARMLGESEVTVAYRSEFIRTRRTLGPLQQKLGSALVIKVVPVGSAGGADAHVREVVASVKSEAPDTVVVIVSHSNTVGPIIEGLGGSDVGPIGDHEFDKVFVLFVSPTGQASTTKLRYGAAT